MTTNRTALTDRAIRHYTKTRSQQSLRERLKQEALTYAKRDLKMAAEWFPLEEEAWQLAPGRKEKNSGSPPRAVHRLAIP
jgi:hypothetical protein